MEKIDKVVGRKLVGSDKIEKLKKQRIFRRLVKGKIVVYD